MKNLLLASLLLLLSACDRSSSSEEQNKALQTIQSWTATAQMVGERWQQGTVPDTYAQQTLVKTQQEIAKETQGLTVVPSELKQQLQQVQQTLQQMTLAVKQKNKAAISPFLPTLAQEQQQLRAFTTAQGKQP